VALNGTHELYLLVDSAGSNHHDHAVWINPRLTGLGQEDLSLTSLEPDLSTVGWGESINVNTGLYGEPIRTWDETEYPLGITAHAKSVIAYKIPEGYDYFEAEGALLYTAKAGEHKAAVVFEVYRHLPEKKLQEIMIRRKN